MFNNLFLNRLKIVTRSGKVAYDEMYHRGVNIIRGDNSSGKSTITHFIFYVLGGAFTDWVKEAKACQYVIAEVEMNGAKITIRRNITINPDTGKGNPIEAIHIYWGDFLGAEKAPFDEWQRFGYQTTSERKSFSNVFFELLDMPIIKGDSNITMHQLLRLMYVDQDSPTASLFFYELFDSSLTREIVSDILLGVYSESLYESKQREIEANKELDDVKSEIRVIKRFIQNPLDLKPSHIKDNIASKEVEIANIESELHEYRVNNKKVRFQQTTKLEFERLNDDLVNQRHAVTQLEDRIRSIQYDVIDTGQFVSVLEKKIKAIRNSITTRDFLGNFPLEYCPECLTPLNEDSSSNQCKLCKEYIDESFGITQARKIEQELAFQIKESKSLLAINERNILDLKATNEVERVKLYQLQVKANESLKDVRSLREERVDDLYTQKGFIEGEIAQLNTLLEQAEIYSGLDRKRLMLEEELAVLDAKIKKMEEAQSKLKFEINGEIEKKGLYLLNNDLKRQQDFIGAKEFNIDYRNNLAFVSDKSARYSASSNFYLKTSARFAIFLASLQNRQMRYPRFIFSDNMEDKGIEVERAFNFQRIVIQEAAKYDRNSYQLIYTTSHIPPELRDSKDCVGEFYTKDSPSLKNI